METPKVFLILHRLDFQLAPPETCKCGQQVETVCKGSQFQRPGPYFRDHVPILGTTFLFQGPGLYFVDQVPISDISSLFQRPGPYFREKVLISGTRSLFPDQVLILGARSLLKLCISLLTDGGKSSGLYIKEFFLKSHQYRLSTRLLIWRRKQWPKFIDWKPRKPTDPPGELEALITMQVPKFYVGGNRLYQYTSLLSLDR